MMHLRGCALQGKLKPAQIRMYSTMKRDVCECNCDGSAIVRTIMQLRPWIGDCSALCRRGIQCADLCCPAQLWERLLCTMPAQLPMCRPMLSCTIVTMTTGFDIRDYSALCRRGIQCVDQCCPAQHRPESKTSKGADPTDEAILLHSNIIILL